MIDAQVSFGLAFLAGLLTFVAPCVLPVLPAFLGYLSGVNMLDANKRSKGWRWHSFFIGLSFVLGFLCIFVLLGISATTIGIFLNTYRRTMQIIGGLIFILLGLHLSGYIQINILSGHHQWHLDKGFTPWQYLNAFFIGLTFGFSWTPCIGPVLAVILFWASQAATFWRGFFLLLSFGLGLGLPFLLLSVLADRLIAPLRKHERGFSWLQKGAGILIALIGITLITGWFTMLVAPLAQYGSLEMWLSPR